MWMKNKINTRLYIFHICHSFFLFKAKKKNQKRWKLFRSVRRIGTELFKNKTTENKILTKQCFVIKIFLKNWWRTATFHFKLDRAIVLTQRLISYTNMRHVGFIFAQFAVSLNRIKKIIKLAIIIIINYNK